MHALESHHHIDGAVDGAHHGGNVVVTRQAGCIQHASASRLISLQSPDRVFEIRLTHQIVFRTRGQGKLKGQGAYCVRRRADSLDRVLELIQRALRPPSCILNRSANSPGPRRKRDGLRDGLGIVSKTILEIGTDRQVGR